ncbi:hypothetical protein NUW58_g8995 [Xylaria curta]|uniref:Uncharacterized protein n=1 Tax=Xylaria curta TaxID=42375 RepID=A0ACC1N2X4_9PEZI|nr:hypothetical protein NUW58_g8995 [Xylaria curta]
MPIQDINKIQTCVQFRPTTSFLVGSCGKGGAVYTPFSIGGTLSTAQYNSFSVSAPFLQAVYQASDMPSQSTSTPTTSTSASSSGSSNVPANQSNVPDSTPHPGLPAGSIPPLHTSNTNSPPSVTSTTPSYASSRASSPKKQMLKLRLYEPILEFNALDLNVLPPAARELVSTMTEIGSNQDILPYGLKSSTMECVNFCDPMPRLWRYAFKCAEDDRADALLPGRIPGFHDVEKICRKANECQQYDHEEVSWNCSVHARLLELVLEDEQGRLRDEFNAMICTTARLYPVWKPMYSPGKMIDICVYHLSSQDEDLRAKILQLSRLTPTGTVNYTDFYPISTRPLVLSIETKKPGVHWEAAQLQIGIWHAAQWAFLRWAVANKLQRQSIKNKEQFGESSLNTSQAQEEERGEKQRSEQGGEQQDEQGDEHDDTETEVLSVISKLGFIPGVIVQGHRWHLVLSTYEDRKTKLWADRQFGSTQTCLETYSVVAGIRRLTEWARDTYIPWFKANVLDTD